jgi:hypothetical protein
MIRRPNRTPSVHRFLLSCLPHSSVSDPLGSTVARKFLSLIHRRQPSLRSPKSTKNALIYLNSVGFTLIHRTRQTPRAVADQPLSRYPQPDSQPPNPAKTGLIHPYPAGFTPIRPRLSQPLSKTTAEGFSRWKSNAARFRPALCKWLVVISPSAVLQSSRSATLSFLLYNKSSSPA